MSLKIKFKYLATKLLVKMRFLLLLVPIVLFLLPVTAITNGCEDTIDPDVACVVRTPVIACSTYDLYGPTNNLLINDGTMEQIVSGSGIYNFTFMQSTTGIHTIILCDNTTAYLDVQASSAITTTDKIEIANYVMTRPVTNSLTLNQTITVWDNMFRFINLTTWAIERFGIN